MRILIDIIPPQHRKLVYAAYAGIGLVLGSLMIAFSPVPEAIIIANSIFAYIGTALGLTAFANTNGESPTYDDDSETVEYVEPVEEFGE